VEGDGPIDWWAESCTAGIVTAFVALFGAVAGVIWHALAPVLDPHVAYTDPEVVSKLMVGDDLWLALVGIVAGVVCVLAVVVVAPRSIDGPGALVGLAVGGCLAMLVADRVGYLIGVPGLHTTVGALYPGISAKSTAYLIGLFDFKARMTAVLLSWPLASVLLTAAIAWVRAVKQPTPQVYPAYPGSP
jgi:hypothetical protein